MLLVPRETRQQQTRRPLSGPTANKYDTLFWLQPKHSGLILNMSRCIGEMHLTPPPPFHQNPVSGVRCILRDNCMNSWIIQRSLRVYEYDFENAAIQRRDASLTKSIAPDKEAAGDLIRLFNSIQFNLHYFSDDHKILSSVGSLFWSA